VTADVIYAYSYHQTQPVARPNPSSA